MRGIWMAGLCLVAGCGEAGPKKLPTVPVAGSLAYKDAQGTRHPVAGALVVFNPAKQADDKNPLYPRGTTGADGRFKLTSYENDDGAPPGDYVVTVVWKQANQSVDPERAGGGADRLGGRYANATGSPLRAKVEAGKPIVLEVE